MWQTIDPAQAIWTQLWQVTLLLTAVGLITRTILKERPRWCNLLWIVTLIKCLVPPLWSSPTAIFSWCQFQVSDVDTLQSSAFGTQSFQWLQQLAGSSALRWLLLAWGVGCLLKAILTLARLRGLYVALTRDRVETPAHVADAFQAVVDRLGVRNVQLRVTRRPLGPAVFGVFRKTLVVPQLVVDKFTSTEIEPIMAHELIHVHRGGHPGEFLAHVGRDHVVVPSDIVVGRA